MYHEKSPQFESKFEMVVLNFEEPERQGGAIAEAVVEAKSERYEKKPRRNRRPAEKKKGGRNSELTPAA